MTDKSTSVANPVSLSAQLPDPDTIISAIRGSLYSGIFRAAVNLDIFNLVNSGANEVASVTKAIAGNERIVRMLLNALCGFGLLAKEGERYAITPFSRLFLVDGPESYARSANYREVFAIQWQAFANFDQLAKTGKPVIDTSKFGAEASYWEALVRYLIPFAIAPAEAAAEVLGFAEGVNKRVRILDLACGSGYFGYYLAQLDPEATIVSNDWENVLKVSRDVAEKMGVAGQVEFLPGDCFSIDLGSDYDVVIVSRILTTVDAEAKRSLLKRAFAALRPGGTVIVNDPIADDDMSEAANQLAFALLISGFHEIGGTYALAECKEWLEGAGFTNVTFHPVRAESSLASAVK